MMALCQTHSSNETRYDNYAITSFLESEAFGTTDIKLDDTTEPADHSVTQEAIPPAGNNFSPKLLNDRFSLKTIKTR